MLIFILIALALSILAFGLSYNRAVNEDWLILCFLDSRRGSSCCVQGINATLTYNPNLKLPPGFSYDFKLYKHQRGMCLAVFNDYKRAILFIDPDSAQARSIAERANQLWRNEHTLPIYICPTGEIT